MTGAVGTLNVILGVVYMSYGVMTWIDLQRGWKTRGISHFGLAWLFMAFTCGPHHFDHGLHLLATETTGGGLDLVAVAVGFPAGVTWFLLRVEAMNGGRGDRQVRDGAPLVRLLPTASAMYAIGLGTAASAALVVGGRMDARLLPNLALVVLYVGIGVVLTRTQLASHRPGDSWSLSGLSLATVFYTCALMHGIWVLYGAIGAYPFNPHLLTIDTLAVPSAAYFLWVVWALSSGRLIDWNRSLGDAHPVAAA